MFVFAMDTLIAQSPKIRYLTRANEEVTINDDYEYIEETYTHKGDTVFVKEYLAGRHLIKEGYYITEGEKKTPIGTHTKYFSDTTGVFLKILYLDGRLAKLESFYKSGKPKRIEVRGADYYLISGTKYAEDGTELPFTPHEQMPMYPGGEPAMMKFLSENISYPKKARKKNIQGTVALSFIVEKDGHLSNVKVLRSVGGGCDEEAVRVIKSMPNWTPAMHDDNPVRVKFTIPIKFRLG
jgi:TonB family protein